MIKNENIGIALGAIVEQVIKICNDEQKANQQLYQMGVDIGHRVADQFTSRSCSFLSPAQSTKKMMIALAEQYMGIKLELTNQSIRFEKKFHYYDLQYTLRQRDVSKSMLCFCQDVSECYPNLVPQQLPAGILQGALQTMNLFGEVQIKKNGSDIVFVVAVKKQIKQED